MALALILLALMNVAEGIVIWQLLNRLLAQARIQPLSTPIPAPKTEPVQAPRPRAVFTVPIQG